MQYDSRWFSLCPMFWSWGTVLFQLVGVYGRTTWLWTVSPQHSFVCFAITLRPCLEIHTDIDIDKDTCGIHIYVYTVGIDIDVDIEVRRGRLPRCR